MEILKKLIIDSHEQEVSQLFNKYDDEQLQWLEQLVTVTHSLGFDWYYAIGDGNKKNLGLRCGRKESEVDEKGNAKDAKWVFFIVTLSNRLGLWISKKNVKARGCETFLNYLQDKDKMPLPLTEEVVNKLLDELNEKGKLSDIKREGYYPRSYISTEPVLKRLKIYTQTSKIQKTDTTEIKLAEETVKNKMLRKAENIIFYGPPGTGKTHTLREKINDYDGKKYKFVTFHQSYSYEDFVEGIRPVLDASGSLKYELKEGVFKELCEKARKEPDQNFAIFIDEINRGNVSKIFGELITLIELDKRTNGTDDNKKWQVELPYSRKPFGVPPNLSIYATMNTADHSLARMDAALRRRFRFQYIAPNKELVPDIIINKDGYDISLRKCFNAINESLKDLLGDADHCLGHSYFLDIKSFEDLRDIIKEQIHPLLQNYFFDQPQKLQEIFKNLIDEKTGELKEDELNDIQNYSQWSK